MLSADVVIRAASSRARVTHCGSRTVRRSATNASWVVAENRRPVPTFSRLIRAAQIRLIGQCPEDQGGDSGAQACGRGARATVVHDRAASRKDGR